VKLALLALLALLQTAPVVPPPDPFGPGSPVVWGTLVNAQLGPPPGHTLWSNGTYPAGGISAQTLAATPGGWTTSGYVVWRITDPRSSMAVSLGNSTWACCLGNYVLLLSNGVLAVRDWGSTTVTVPVVSGDVAGIANGGGLVWYVLNGRAIYVSPFAPGSPLKVFVSLQLPNATATQVYVGPTWQ
jgi:hypothetical protein